MAFCRIILESDSSVISQKVSFRSDDIPLGEQTVAQVRQYTSLQISRSVTLYGFPVYNTDSSEEYSLIPL